MIDPARYQAYVQAIEEMFYDKALEEGHPPVPLSVKPVAGRTMPGKTILLCSPHPDDEALSGTLPLRLLKETGARVINIAITLGGRGDRRAARLAELEQACTILGFDNTVAVEPLAYAQVTGLSRGQDPKQWREMVAGVCSIFARLTPDLVLYPHGADCHPTHVGTHALVFEALQRYSRQAGCRVLTLESECWQPMAAPNLLVGVNGREVALMMAALAAHGGEVARNPYHLRLPARLMENVRRVGERLVGFGLRPPGFAFGEVYRLGLIRDGFQEFAPASILPPEIVLSWQGLIERF
ncbi:MAG: PIG-L family deacetylase [Desulfobulbaceae bacterium]|nr:PIG-L family deacetylase [Desulfobulbaceae bacterium]HIJ77869.1 PIG-L family deacetylase [Deltaproteobacteria bacterium]